MMLEKMTEKVSELDKDKRELVNNIKNSIELSSEGILGYGQGISKDMSDFSTELLENMKIKDDEGIEEIITTLMKEITTVNPETLIDKKPSFLQRIFKTDNIRNFVLRYDDVSSVIKDVVKQLENSQYQLKKDINLCNMYLENNIKYINELDLYILAGMMKVEEESIKLTSDRQTIDSDDMFEVQKIANRQDEIGRLERKMHDLSLMRVIAVQNIPQLRLIRDGDSILVEKIQSSINSAIPLWESQIVIAIQIMRQQGALRIQKAVTDTTNKLIEKNSEMLKTNAIGIATELERGIVDVEVLKKSTENIIDTLEGIKKVREEGRNNRIKATSELGELQMKLNNTMMVDKKELRM